MDLNRKKTGVTRGTKKPRVKTRARSPRTSDREESQIFNAMPDPIVSMDLAGFIRTFNQAAENISGYGADEIVGKHFTKTGIIKVKYLPVALYEFGRIVLGEKRVPVEIEIENRKKERIFIEAHGGLIANPSSREKSVFVILRDISKRKTLEQNLLFSDECQRVVNQILNMSISEISLKDFLGDVLDAVLKIKRFEIEPKGAIFLADGESKKLTLTAQKRLAPGLLKTCQTVEFGSCLCGTVARDQKLEFASHVDERHERHYEGMTGHGHYAVPLVHGSELLGVLLLYLKEGHAKNTAETEFLKMLGQTIGSTIRHRQDSANLAKLSAAVYQSANAILITDREGTIEYVNDAFTKITGYAAEEAVGQNPRILKSGRHPAERYEKLWLTITSGKTWRGTFYNKKKNGDLYVASAVIDPIRNTKGEVTHFVGIQEDITALEKLKEEFLQAQKMEAVGELAGGVAHDFNNQLLVINGYAEFLLSEISKEDPKYREVEEIKKAADRSAALTRQLLTFSCRQHVSPSVINLNKIILDLDKMFRRLIGENIELVVILHETLHNIKADPGQMEQVLANLVVNARDAMPQGGKLTLETSHIDLDGEEAGWSFESPVTPGKYVMLSVSDTGTGMPPEVVKQVFVPFFTTKQKGKGTGLGLSTCYGIVTQSGGHIHIYSEPGHGTAVKVYLPFTDEPASESSPSGNREEIPRGSETILMVEDEPSVRQVGITALRKQGYRILEASNGDEALNLLRGEPGIDMLLTDVVMPGMSGRELAERIREVRPAIKVLFVSGFTDNLVLGQEIEQGAVEFLQKPYSPRALAIKVREVLDRNQAKPER